MKIEVIKPQEEVKWKFPCLGKSKSHRAVVYFHSDGVGVVVEQSSKYPYLYRSSVFDMQDFEPYIPTETKPQPIDWDKVELPIWAVRGEWIMKIESLEETSLDGLEFQESLNNIQGTRLGFKDKQDRDKYLNSLEILPKGTKITIEL